MGMFSATVKVKTNHNTIFAHNASTVLHPCSRHFHNKTLAKTARETTRMETEMATTSEATTLHPWVPTELAPSTKKKNLVDQICDVFQRLWADDEENARALATSTDKDDAVEGSPTIDKILLASLVKRMAPASSHPEDLANVKVGKITPVMHHATKRFGIDRVAIAARKAEYLAINAAPVED